MIEKFPEPNSLDSMEGVPSSTDKEKTKVISESAENPVNLEKLPIFELNGDMWQKYKEVRLRSGETNPEAWGSSIQKEPEKDEEYWRGKLEDPNFRMFAIEMDDKIVAMLGLQQKPDGRWFLRRLYSVPEMRGKGLAKVLIDRVLNEARKSGAEKIYLGVTEGIPAINLYKRLGFKEIGRNKDEIRGDGKPRDEILMEKKFE